MTLKIFYIIFFCLSLYFGSIGSAILYTTLIMLIGRLIHIRLKDHAPSRPNTNSQRRSHTDHLISPRHQQQTPHSRSAQKPRREQSTSTKSRKYIPKKTNALPYAVLRQLCDSPIFADTKSTQAFFHSEKHNLTAKPDFLYRLKSGGYAVIECKSSKHITKSAEIQLAATALVVNEDTSDLLKDVHVKTGFIVLQNGTFKQYDLVDDENLLYVISPTLETARKIANRIEPSCATNPAHCGKCQQSHQCKYASL